MEPWKCQSHAGTQVSLPQWFAQLLLSQCFCQSGMLPVLVLLNQLWVVVLESKKTALSVWAALAYLMANPQPAEPSFGLVTNGDEILFVKLVQQEKRYYALSRVFSPFTSKRELYSVLQILKHIGQEMGAAVN